MPTTRQRKNVALLIETSNRYSRDILDGIRAFVRERFSWSVQLHEQGRGQISLSWLKNWSGDGMIARAETPEIADAVRKKGVPIVNVSATAHMPECISVITDSPAATQLEFDHLRERGFREFAFCGDARFPWSESHGQNFQRHAERSGSQCHLFPTQIKDVENWDRERRLLTTWLKKLPKPIGIMACYDIRGQQLLQLCREMQLHVPGQVAVVGWHNDEILCELCDPPLSSVIPNSKKVGYEAAAILDHLMAGRYVDPGVRLIGPLGVATRQSTDVVAVDDPHVVGAVRFIRDHACDGITVSDVVRVAGTSRTLLERSYKRLLETTLHDSILATRLDRVKQMLAETELSLSVIAERTGFDHPEYLSVAFRKHTGLSPKEFRREARG